MRFRNGRVSPFHRVHVFTDVLGHRGAFERTWSGWSMVLR